MKTRMNEVSIDAFFETDKSEKRKKVLEVIKKFEASDYYITSHFIARVASMPLQTVTGRINELRYDYGLIKVDGKCKRNTTYRLRKPDEEPDERPLSWEQKHEKLLGELGSLHNSIVIAKQMNSASVENIFHRLRVIIMTNR